MQLPVRSPLAPRRPIDAPSRLKNVSQTHLLAIREQSSFSAAPAAVPPLRHLAPVTGKMAQVWRIWMGVVAYRGRPAAALA